TGECVRSSQGGTKGPIFRLRRLPTVPPTEVAPESNRWEAPWSPPMSRRCPRTSTASARACESTAGGVQSSSHLPTSARLAACSGRSCRCTRRRAYAPQHRACLAGISFVRRSTGECAPIAVLPGYTERVKTAISVPDDTFEQATKRASELGISRSEFFSRAARRYLDELGARSLTKQIDDALR